MRKILTLRALQAVKGNDSAIAEILRALRKTRGNMRDACELLGVGKSSMYRLIKDLECADAVDDLIRSLNAKVNGKVLEQPQPTTRKRRRVAATAAPESGPKLRVRRVA